MNIKIGVLCNSAMAIPALQRIAGSGALCFVATADTNPESQLQVRDAAVQMQATCHTIHGLAREQQLQQLLEESRPDIVFVMTWSWRITTTMMAIPRMGFLNFHYGLLPEMRGADPIFESIRQRKPTAGTTVHKMDEGLDTGPIAARQEVPLRADYTYGMLSSQMAMLGDELCAQIMTTLQEGREPAYTVQDETRAAYWPKVGPEALAINWNNNNLEDIIALVRACNPIAKGVPAMVNNWHIAMCDVTEVNLQGDATAIAPGTILALDQQNGLIVCCKGGKALKLEIVYTAEGIFPGYKLGVFGIQAGMVFA